MSDEKYCRDVRGVLRGECTVCECKLYVRPQTGAACSLCKHVPAKHKNLDEVNCKSVVGPPASSSTVESQARMPQRE